MCSKSWMGNVQKVCVRGVVWKNVGGNVFQELKKLGNVPRVCMRIGGPKDLGGNVFQELGGNAFQTFAWERFGG